MDTSGKRADESWLDYADRLRHERHGPDCKCYLCANEVWLRPLSEHMLKYWAVSE